VTLEFRFHKETKASYGKMKGQNMKTRGTVFISYSNHYVWMMDYLYSNPKMAWQKGPYNPVPPHEEIWITDTHQKDSSKSKTEVLYIPPPGKETSDTDRDNIFVDRTYQGYVTFRRFTYLGSIITDDLEDSAEIHARTGKANGILHSLNNLWRSKGLYVRIM
jgi:hypothetical protein